jgi:hypothetical protein
MLRSASCGRFPGSVLFAPNRTSCRCSLTHPNRHLNGCFATETGPTSYEYSSAFAVIRVSVLVRRLRVAFLTFADRRTRMTGLTEAEFVLSTRNCRWRSRHRNGWFEVQSPFDQSSWPASNRCLYCHSKPPAMSLLNDRYPERSRRNMREVNQR